jgi:hypothetical protein
VTRPTPPSGVTPDVVEIDALNMEEWEGAQYTPQVGDAKLEALVKQTQAAPPPPVEPTTGTKPRTKTQAMPHVVVRPPAPPTTPKKTATSPVGVPVAVPLKRTATPPAGVPAPRCRSRSARRRRSRRRANLRRRTRRVGRCRTRRRMTGPMSPPRRS